MPLRLSPILSHVSGERVGIFIRGLRGSSDESLHAPVAPVGEQLESMLKVPMSETNYTSHVFADHLDGDCTDISQHPRLVEWLAARAAEYEAALRSLLDS